MAKTNKQKERLLTEAQMCAPFSVGPHPPDSSWLSLGFLYCFHPLPILSRTDLDFAYLHVSLFSSLLIIPDINKV